MKYRMRVSVICFFFFISAVSGFSQTEEATNILSQTQSGVLVLIFYGADKSEIGKSTAILVDQDVAATAYHMVASAYDAEAMNFKGKKFKVEGVLGVDKERDIALLKIKGKFEPLTPGSFESLAVGERIFALGSNESGNVGVSEGTVRRIMDLSGGRTALEFSLTAPDQFRGAPVLNLAGQVVGIFLVLDRDTKFAFPYSPVLDITRSAKAIGLKEYTKEDYFNTFEGCSLAGRVANAIDNQRSAVAYLEKAVGLDSSFLEGHMLLASLYAKQRDLAKAAAAFTKVTEIEPEKAEAHYGLGLVLASMMKFQEAAVALEQAISLGIPVKEIYFELGGIYESLNDWGKAAAAYEKFINSKPEVAWNAFLRLGICRMNMGEYEAAVAALIEAEKGQPKDLKIKYSLAEVYQKAGQLEKAEEVFDQMAVLNPKDAKSYYMQIIGLYDAAGEPEKAIGPIRKVIELEPSNEANYYNLGLMFFKLERYPEAVEAFKKCLEIKPEYSNAWFQIASAEFQQKKYKEAISAYKNYVTQAPNEASGWLSIGVCYMYLKDYESALEPLKKCVDLNPASGPALYNLAVCYINLYDEYSAGEIQKKLAGIDPALAEKLAKALKR